MSTSNKTGKAQPQSNRETANIPKTRAPGVPTSRNPPQRPSNPAHQQPGDIALGHHPNFSKSPGDRSK
jgi:hypothetical protein